MTPEQAEVAKGKFIRLAKRGKAMEKAWDRAVLTGDVVAQDQLSQKAVVFNRAWEKYEAMGLHIYLVRGEYRVTVKGVN